MDEDKQQILYDDIQQKIVKHTQFVKDFDAKLTDAILQCMVNLEKATHDAVQVFEELDTKLNITVRGVKVDPHMANVIEQYGAEIKTLIDNDVSQQLDAQQCESISQKYDEFCKLLEAKTHRVNEFKRLQNEAAQWLKDFDRLHQTEMLLARLKEFHQHCVDMIALVRGI